MREHNDEVELNHLVLDSTAEKPMIVMHGLLGNMLNWRPICKHPEISSLRKCYLVEMRNHAKSNHHADMDYKVMSDDIVRFADKHNLDKFTVMGHSLGGRTAMTTACRYPDRVEGVISVDSAPKDEVQHNQFGSFTYSVIDLMIKLENEGVSKENALEQAKEFFKGKG
mmetsp:Transcript_15071/g.10550  ORF Transcript_15071/g.10550 Transcript_15071/m.10550 type:complete len:168 (+) Transcript_15071:94-597(+)